MTQQITPNNEIELSLLEKIQKQLKELPEKQKTRYGTKEAVAFLYEDLKTAMSKNYTLGEISEILMASGWEIRENSLKYFWKMFRHEEKKSSDSTVKKKKNIASKKIRKELKQTEKIEPKQNRETAEESAQAELKNQTPKAAEGMKGKGQQKQKKTEEKTAYFELPPDTDDL